MTYIPVEGTREDILNSDINSVKAELDSVNFEVSSTASTYSEEFKTTNYVSNLFKTLEQAREYWNQVVNLSNQYHEKMESIPLPESPIEVSIVDDEPSDENSTVPVSSSNTNYYKGIVNTMNSNLNVRATPNGEIIGSLSKGSKIEVIDYNTNTGWSKVLIDGKEAYVSTKYVKIDNLSNHNSQSVSSQNFNTMTSSPTKVDSVEVKPAVVDITNGSLNVRTSPNGEIIGSLGKGSEIQVVDYNADTGWSKVLIDGKEAYVFSKYIKLK